MKIKISKISSQHYVKLVYRSALFLAAAAVYIVNRVRRTGSLFGGYEDKPVILGFIWVVFAVEMLCRFFPAPTESMGCQKQFARNYVPRSGGTADRRALSRGVPAVALSWIGLNAVIGVLYLTRVLDEGIVLLICLAFSVCDMICILFFCPFQTWMMKNKCCGSCRIYNWDYAMMFTPLLFVPRLYTWSLAAMSLALLVKWEIVFYRHPERFSENTNLSLTCGRCQEKLCHHKVQLQHFLEYYRSKLL